MGAGGWWYELEGCKARHRLRHYSWDSFRSYRDVTAHRRKWSEHRKTGKLNRKRLRRARMMREEDG